ncbi:ribosomal protein L7Ae/L30e/S12e/Gadd45 [Alicyclobacillus hesperidum URH17-3-68]|uniref:50S ribosomal protein L7ae n=1 Tax=Alicyclobacillus hesperidum TaxID=89784 RepID=A0AA37U930_9BACL|nr:ribosomal L7Ae/L30e/S12e/Gadd45 family protein [Alicyclobacillus hesperidum]EJY55602.1 ribosomal protein L7Ae/L30e/S12e/Gadd45 [Alicyclobacillus hesperidum URH17-3-68]GLV12403.1 50S ribosomal protein L7ae [Alicyclobacillus hesperidum]
MPDAAAVLSLLGMARRARAAIDGQDRILAAISSGQAKLVIVAVDSGLNGRKKMFDKTSYYHVPIVEFGDKAELGKAIGRKEAAAIAIVEDGFANKLRSRIGETLGGGAFDENSSV